MQPVIHDPIEHIYIHVPFCLKKCGYCSFYSEKIEHNNLNSYVSTLLKEIELLKDKFNLIPATIYLGGGTPSLLEPGHIQKIIRAFDTSNIKEITLEANPVTINRQLSVQWKQAGITRVSLGVQSFIEKELKLLGRLHRNEHTYAAWQFLQEAGIANVSLDLIYGLPYQKTEDVKYSLEKALKLSPCHISIYCLSLEESVPLYALNNDLPSDDLAAEFYEIIRTELIAAGYQHYEISNFSLPGFKSKHNSAYWNDKFYLGLGPSAAGYIPLNDKTGEKNRARYTNPADLKQYFSDLNNHQIIKDPQFLSRDEHQKEYIFLALRKKEGLNLEDFQKLFNEDLMEKYSKQTSEFIDLELMEIKAGQLRLKPAAYFVSNEIFSRFI